MTEILNIAFPTDQILCLVYGFYSAYLFDWIGPNTIGLITPDVNATFAFADVKRGKAAIVAQSGGLGVYMPKALLYLA